MKGCDCQGVGHVPWCRSIMANASAGTAEQVAEQIAAWLDELSDRYEEKCRQAARSNDPDGVEEFGWAASYADGFAASVRNGEWRKERG